MMVLGWKTVVLMTTIIATIYAEDDQETGEDAVETLDRGVGHETPYNWDPYWKNHEERFLENRRKMAADLKDRAVSTEDGDQVEVTNNDDQLAFNLDPYGMENEERSQANRRQMGAALEDGDASTEDGDQEGVDDTV